MAVHHHIGTNLGWTTLLRSMLKLVAVPRACWGRSVARAVLSDFRGHGQCQSLCQGCEWALPQYKLHQANGSG